ncbi:putative NAC domain-containing protein [Melia azedarach]|uniref:NAC domain-containing protein n=1 Tax=Melia azedarach TaxID=155640 RepID=A0ACC1YHS7_MELAZ|nr:putative NAC domain-containing protein [Melia azedarach]
MGLSEGINVDDEMMMMPTGFRFNPTDEELIHLLERKVSGQAMRLHAHFMIERDVYQIDPQHLQWYHDATLSKNERYYYCLKENDSREVAGQGWWRATGHLKKIYVNDQRHALVGYKRPLTFYRFRDDQIRRKKAVKTNWIMHEYTLESFPTEWRLCKIKYKGKPSAQEELENPRKAGSNSNSGNTSIIAEKQQQQQKLQLSDNHSAYDHERSYYYSEANNFSDISVVENHQQQQLQTLQLENDIVYDSYNNIAENMQVDAMEVEQALYDPYYYCYDYFGDYNHQLEQAAADLSEQIIPTLWSWQN